MRYSIAICLAFAVSVATAAPISFQPLPPTAFADTEVSTNCALAVWNSNMRRFRFKLDFNATPSNNVQVAFGADADGDGSLGVAETSMAIGWDCGKWFVDTPPQGRLEAAPASVDGLHSLPVEVRLSPSGAAKSVAIADGDSAIFQELPNTGALYSRTWDTMRLTARGIDDPGEQFQLRLLPDGMVIFLK